MDIYALLSSKPHNKHYLKKYITYIERCQQKNVGIVGYVEKHHICPKANDMFPEYKSFTENPWNCVILTARQHFIAHMMLWKVYENSSMTLAFGIMSNCRTIKNSRIYQNIRRNYTKLVSEQMKNTVTIRTENGTCKRISKEEFDKNDKIIGSTSGMTYAVDSKGNRYRVTTGDPRFSTGELRGNNAGTITITDGETNRRINPNDDIPNGWRRGMTKDSPKGSIWINNGETSKMFMGDQIPEGWRRGRVFTKKPKHVGTTGKIYINNGKVNQMIKKEASIPKGWDKGRLSVK